MRSTHDAADAWLSGAEQPGRGCLLESAVFHDLADGDHQVGTKLQVHGRLGVESEFLETLQEFFVIGV